MSLSEDRISHLSHVIMERLWRDDLADFNDERRALECVKGSLSAFFHVAEEIDEAVRAKMKNRIPGSRDWDILYHKYYQEELARRKW
jgi:hypothetical protein